MRRADFSVQLQRRKAACVLDTALLLGHAQGPALALCLAQELEPWLTRSFWQALDASELLCLHGQVAAGAGAVHPLALARWVRWREGVEPGQWFARWIGDCMAESVLREDADAALIERYEGLAEALQSRDDAAGGKQEAWRPGLDAVVAARDALALSAALDGAIVLADAAPGALPAPLQTALRARLVASVEPVDVAGEATLFGAERRFLRDALARAGLAPLLQSLPPLAVLHAWIDETAVAQAKAAAALAEAPPDPWVGARIAWYRL